MGCEFSDRVRNFKRGLIKELFQQLSEKSQNSFNTQYGDIDKINEDDFYKIYSHCKRVLKFEKPKQ